jgi:amidophosphoribosyltransferase
MDAVAHRHINTSSDSELLLNIFADNLNDTGKFRINEEDIFVAIRRLMTQARGAYACVAMLAGFGIIAFRDPNGIRPLGVACRATQNGAKDWLCASESAVADVAGFIDWEDVRPGTPKLCSRSRIRSVAGYIDFIIMFQGEAVIMTRSRVSRRQVAPAANLAPDIFEFVYFARPDSVIDGISVYRSRMAMGNALAQEVQRVLTEKQITVDVVIPVPDTSRVAALNLAQALGLPYREGIVKNRYVGRTFIMPEQQMRCVVHDHLLRLWANASCYNLLQEKKCTKKAERDGTRIFG